VIVDGKLLVENRQVLTVDESQVLIEAQAEAEATIERANLHHLAYLEQDQWRQTRRPDGPEPFDLEWQRKDGGHY
jgi:5-methylthioadenosine/S-adenosylhomocysteine deaminase